MTRMAPKTRDPVMQHAMPHIHALTQVTAAKHHAMPHVRALIDRQVTAAKHRH